MNAVTVNSEQRLYVDAAAGCVSCLGFDNTRNHANQIADRLGRLELAFTVDDDGSVAGYEKYKRAVHAWGQSPRGQETYFDPGTDPAAAIALESHRRTQHNARLVLGDTVTGQSWFDEFDAIGRIDRSTGWLKVPAAGGGWRSRGCDIRFVGRCHPGHLPLANRTERVFVDAAVRVHLLWRGDHWLLALPRLALAHDLGHAPLRAHVVDRGG